MTKRWIVRSVVVYTMIVILCSVLFQGDIKQAFIGGFIAALTIRGASFVVHIIPGFLGTVGRYSMISIIFKSFVGIVFMLVLLIAGLWVLLTVSALLGAVMTIKDIIEAVRFDRGLISSSESTEIWDI